MLLQIFVLFSIPSSIFLFKDLPQLLNCFQSDFNIRWLQFWASISFCMCGTHIAELRGLPFKGFFALNRYYTFYSGNKQ